MIALDTNAIVRVIIEDDLAQAKKVQSIIQTAEKNGQRILILTEVVIETAWVLESVYDCSREEVAQVIENLLSAQTFYLPDAIEIRKTVRQFKKKGDFADLLIVHQAKKYQAEKLFSFDKKLQKLFPDFVAD